MGKLSNIYVLNREKTVIGVIDNAESIIWTSRYFETGDFEIYITATDKNIDLLRTGYYLTRKDNTMVGLIENIDLVTNIENGDYLTVTGRDASCILGRRIVWDQTNLTGNVATGINRLIDRNLINSAISERNIPGFKIAAVDTTVFTEKMDTQLTGDNLLDSIILLCKKYNYGFNVSLDENKNFVFSLYIGTDRSYGQTSTNKNPYVIFCPNFDNFISSEYTYKIDNYKNVALIAGEGDGNARKKQTIGNASGIDRYELFVDAKDVSSNDGEIDETNYNLLLRERGFEKLAETGVVETFNGQVDSTRTYRLGIDYFLGDIVTVENEYKMQKNVRVTEIIECLDVNGYSITPTFADLGG